MIKSLAEYVKEGVAISLGNMMANSTFMTPGNTIGMGDPKLPTHEEPGSGDLMGTTRKDKYKKKKKEKDN